jgi:hypothetical protein
VSTTLPGVNALCRVVLDATDERPSRIEADDNGLLTIAAPWHAAALAPEPGHPLAVRWPSVRGICEVAATLVAVERENAVPLWRVQTEGEVRVLQRRRFARADAVAPVTLTPLSQDGDPAALPVPVLGTVVDLSEGGARCRFDGMTQLAAAGLRSGGEVELQISLGAAVVRVVGLVLRVSPDMPRTADDAGEMVVAFEAPEHAGVLIRRFVLEQQVLARRAARDA